MLRKTIRRSGMLALVLALALAGTVPAAAMDFGGRSLDGWHAVWSSFMAFFGWGNESSSSTGNSGGLIGVFERSGAGFDPNGNPLPPSTSPGTDAGAGFDPNGED